MCAEAPNTSRQDAAAEKIAGLSESQFQWVKDQYAAEAPTRQAAADRANTAADMQITQGWKSMALADESAADYRRIYRPLEERAAQDAASYNTEEHASTLAGRAQADVQAAAASARGTTARNLASMGVNPTDGAYATAAADGQRNEALMTAAARTKARSDAETVGRALRSDVIGTGRGVVGSQGTQAGLSVNAAGAGASTGVAPVNIAQGGVQMVNQAAGQAVNGLQSSANIFANSSQAQANASQASSQGVGALAGAAMTAATIF